MKLSSLYSVVAALSVALVLAGCTSMATQTSDEIDAQARHADAMKAQQAAQNKAPAPAQFNSGFYLGSGQTTHLNSRAALPQLFSENVTLVANDVFLYQAADKISAVADLPVSLDPMLIQEQQQSGGQSQGGDQAARQGLQMTISYEGQLSGLLDQVAAHYGISWRFDGTTITFYKYETRTFVLAVLPGSLTTQSVVTNASNIGGASSGAQQTGGSTATSTQTVTASQNADTWKSFVGIIKNMLTQHGTLQESQDAGSITVTDTPETLDRIGTVVDQFNLAMRRQAAFTLRIYSLDMSSESQRGFSLNALFTNLAKQYSVGVVGAVAPIGTTSDASVTATVLTPTNIDSALGQGHWAGSTSLAQVLDQYGKVALVTEGSGIAMQGQPLPIQVTATQGYLASSSTIIGTAATAGSVSLTPGQVTTGFSMVLTPRILPNGDVILEYALDLSNLNSIQTISSGGQEIQVPNVSSRRFVQRAELHSGDTLILSGYEQTNNTDQGSSGLLSWFRGTSSDHQVIFITLDVNVL